MHLYRSILIGALVFALLHSPFSAAAKPLVTAEWTFENLDREGVVVLDVRTAEEFSRDHISSAVWTNHPKHWLVHNTRLPNDTYVSSYYSDLFGELGIGDDSYVIVAAAGTLATDVAKAAHVYWVLKLMGHDDVSILDGGIAAYRSAYPQSLSTTAITPEAKTFTAKVDLSIHADLGEVRHFGAQVVLLDVRPQAQFLGANKIPGAAHYGTIPGAINIPIPWLTVNGGGKIRTAQALRRVFAYQHAPIDKPTIVFSNVGILGSLGWFAVREILGNQQVQLYSASMVEWTKDATNPVERRMAVD